jgi:transposase-like protein
MVVMPAYTPSKVVWSDSTKYDVVALYLETRNLKEVSRQLAINYEFLQGWKTEPWWDEIVNEIEDGKARKLARTMENIVDKSLNAVEDRLEHGDYAISPTTGLIIRKPVSMKDAAKVASDLIDKKAKVEEKYKKELASTAIPQQLLELAKQFASFAKAKEIKHEPITLEMEK